MSEGVELPEHDHHDKHPLTIPVSVTMAILAVLGALVTLLGHRAHTEELLLQAQATDQWAYYQAKNIRLHEMEAVADMIGALAPQDKDKAAAVHEKYVKEVERYKSDKENIGDIAKEVESERDLVSRRADRFDGGEALLDVGLVICSVTLLTKRRYFWYTGMLFGAAGVILASTGFFIH
jgi:Domain of unknown function (DUF4337)